MTEERFQKRYIEKNNKVFDTWKNIPISRELDRYSLSHIISHLNGLGEIIDSQIEQGRYCFRKYYELKKENEQLKQSIDTKISVEDNYRKHLEIYSDQYFKLKEYINELLTKKYNHYEEMRKTIQNKEAQRIYTNILKVIKELQEDVDTEWKDLND